MTSGESLLLVAISHQYSLHYYIDNYYKKKQKNLNGYRILQKAAIGSEYDEPQWQHLVT